MSYQFSSSTSLVHIPRLTKHCPRFVCCYTKNSRLPRETSATVRRAQLKGIRTVITTLSSALVKLWCCENGIHSLLKSMTQPSSSTPSDMKVAAAQLLAELLPYCVTNLRSGSSSGGGSRRNCSGSSNTMLPALQSSGMPWAAATDSNRAAATAAAAGGASKKSDVQVKVAVGACGEQALAVIQNLCDSCCAPTIAQLHSILQQITGQVIVCNSTATTATSTVAVSNTSTPNYDSRLALSIVTAWCGLAVWAVTDTATPVTTTSSSASSSSSTDKGVTQAALNLHKMVTFASQLTNDWRWALLLSQLQLLQVNSSVGQLFERSSSSSGTAVAELKSALAAIHVQAFTGSGVVYTNSAVTAYKHSVQVGVCSLHFAYEYYSVA
jgi:hypothetical protein